MLGKFNREPAMRGTMQSGQKAFDNFTRNELEAAKFSEVSGMQQLDACICHLMKLTPEALVRRYAVLQLGL